MSDPVIVIGAGIGGLSAAIRLAAAGRPVIIYEQNSFLGGKMGEVAEAGFRWDTGPSVITMRHVLEDLFAAVGRRLDDYLTLMPVEPTTRYFYPDGVVLDATRDLTRMVDQIAALDARAPEGYLAFLAHVTRQHRITGPVFLYSDPPTLRTLTQVPLRDILRVDVMRSMDAAIRHYIRSPHLRQLLGRFATYVGASPYQASAAFNVIAYVEMVGGVWYPRGGVYAIARALSRLAEELEVEIHTGKAVSRIRVEDNTVQGVELADGVYQPASAVIANVDVATVYEKLLPPAPAARRQVKRLERAGLSCSGFVILLGVEGRHPQLAQHNIFFSPDYPREFDDIFKRGIPPADPTIYVTITSKADASHAPEGCENWFVMVNAPPLGPAFDWEKEAAGYRDRVLALLAERYGLDVRDRIRVERHLTPADIERMTGARRGALYGISNNRATNIFLRPPNRAAHVRGLYFAGGTTHPGGGVPMVMLSGKLAAKMILSG
jgi:phytoene desaturase